MFIHLQTAQYEEMDDFDGPRVIILEQICQKMEDIRRIGNCYLGVSPPRSLVYCNDSYDSNGLDVSEHTTLIFFYKNNFYW